MRPPVQVRPVQLMKTKICKICGKEFETNSKTKFCSNYCKTINQKMNVLLHYFGLNLNNLGTIDFIKDFENCKENLYKLYWIDNCCFDEISKIYNYPNPGNLTKVFKSLGIPRRSFSESNTLAIQRGRKQLPNIIKHNYKTGYHITWFNKKIWYRSSYELNYAKLLDEQKIYYEVESKRINYFNSKTNSYKIAIPDFYLPETNTLVEIKSFWTLDLQTIKDKINEYLKSGYKVKLILEQNEIDLTNITTDFKSLYDFISENTNDYHVSFTGWKWMHKDNINKKVMINDIDTFKSDGWVLGRKFI